MSLCIYCCLGTLFFCDLFLFLSLFTAISPYFVLPCLVLVLLALGRLRIIRMFCQYGTLFLGKLPDILIACLLASTLCLPEVVWGDTHLYHYPITRWLAEYGIIPGLGNLQEAYANSHGWFVLTAFWDHGVLEGRMGAFGGSFVVTLLIFGLCSAIRGLSQKHNNFANSVFLIAGTLVFLVLSTYHNILNSLSPDLMPQLIILVCSWLWLNSSFGDRFRKNMALLLAAFVLGIRLSTAPLLLILGFFYLMKNPQHIYRCLGLLLLILIPPGLSTFLSSGCFFFPVPWFCLPSPASITEGTAQLMRLHIQEYSRWCGKKMPVGAQFLDWVPSWLECEYGSLFLVSGITFAWILLLFLLLIHRPKLPGLKEIILIQIAGTWFVLYNAPATRYGVAWFCLGMALPIAMVCKNYLRPPLFSVVLLLGYYWMQHPMRHEIKNFVFWDRYLAHTLFEKSAKASSQGDTFLAYILSNWACTMDKGLHQACSDTLFYLGELRPEDLLRINSKEEDLIRNSITLPQRKNLPFILPFKANASFKNLIELQDWEGISVTVPDSINIEGLCSSARPPCIHKYRLSEIQLLKPELGVVGGFKRAGFTP
ncbi:MAG: hypothetical protein H3C47_01910 [Candidatus Cloacimonetes bacterium]|nr:hypothetical protein [Candidatus Cloacimonadota bacterium]